MIDQPPENRGLKFRSGFVVDCHLVLRGDVSSFCDGNIGY
jgi:hypothetical protein